PDAFDGRGKDALALLAGEGVAVGWQPVDVPDADKGLIRGGGVKALHGVGTQRPRYAISVARLDKMVADAVGDQGGHDLWGNLRGRIWLAWKPPVAIVGSCQPDKSPPERRSSPSFSCSLG